MSRKTSCFDNEKLLQLVVLCDDSEHISILGEENGSISNVNGLTDQLVKSEDDSTETKKKKKKKKTRKETETDHESRETSQCDGENSSLNLGQWSTAQLGDTQRQNKFFKLLGGFKSSNSTANPSTKPFAAKFNAALDKKREASLNNELEKQFEQARHARLNAKGLGLGFEKPKQNSIDITASRSKKFDD